MTSFKTEKPDIRPVHIFPIRSMMYTDTRKKEMAIMNQIDQVTEEVKLNRELIKDIVDFMYTLATKEEMIQKAGDLRSLAISTLSDIANHMKENQRQLNDIERRATDE